MGKHKNRRVSSAVEFVVKPSAAYFCERHGIVSQAMRNSVPLNRVSLVTFPTNKPPRFSTLPVCIVDILAKKVYERKIAY